MPSPTKKRRPITPEDLTQFVSVSDPQISPDGSRVLMCRSHVGDKNQAVSNLWITSVQDNHPPRQFTSGDNDSHPRWSPDGRQIGFTSARNNRKPQIYVLQAEGGEARQLTDFPEGTIRGWAWSPDGKTLAVSFRETDADRTEEAEANREETGSSTPPWEIEDMFYRLDGDGYFGSARFQLYLVDTQSGEHRLLFARGTAPGGQALWRSRLRRYKVGVPGGQCSRAW